MKYKSIVAAQPGGPEVLQITENDLSLSAAEEIRIKILAVPICLPDVQARYALSPFPPKFPFTPGYAIIGDVDAVGEGVSSINVGERVAALTVYGGYSEMIYLNEEMIIPIPKTLDPAEAIRLILNYIVAYQTLHRSAKVQTGDKILIIGASGGIGTAYLQLGQLAGLKMYGLASPGKHAVLEKFGAFPIDYHTEVFEDVIQEHEPDGLDAVFDGISGTYFKRGYSVLAEGGVVVGYGNPTSLGKTFRLLGQLIWFNLRPDRKSAKLYGTSVSKWTRASFLEDWNILFNLLETKQIKPIIMQKLPLLEAAKANAILESGKVTGNIVLVAPELL